MNEKKNFQRMRLISMTMGFVSIEFILLILMIDIGNFTLLILYTAILSQMELPGIKKIFDFKYHSEQVKKKDLLSLKIIGILGIFWIFISIYWLYFKLITFYLFILTYIITIFQIIVYNILKLKSTKLKQSITNLFHSWLIIEGYTALFLVILIFFELIFNLNHIPLSLLIYLGMEGITNILFGFKGAIFYDTNNISENNNRIE